MSQVNYNTIWLWKQNVKAPLMPRWKLYTTWRLLLIFACMDGAKEMKRAPVYLASACAHWCIRITASTISSLTDPQQISISRIHQMNTLSITLTTKHWHDMFPERHASVFLELLALTGNHNIFILDTCTFHLTLKAKKEKCYSRRCILALEGI